MGTVRLLLALCVVVEHSGHPFLGLRLLSGNTAVQCFYVISGFLITMVLNERREYVNVKAFYLSRYLRLWPAYAVIALLTLAISNWSRMVEQLPSLANWPEIVFVAFSNATLFFQDWFLFVRFDSGHLVPTAAFGVWPGPHAYNFLLVPQCWSIGVELTFYLIAPFVCLRWQSLTAMFAISIGIRMLVVYLYPAASDPWTYRFAPSEMMLFASGGLSYFIGRTIKPKAIKPSFIFAVALMAILVFIARYTGYFKLIGLSSPLILITMTIAVAPLFYGSRYNKFDGLMGDLSYPMYISHLLIFSLVTRLPPEFNVGNVLYVVSVITFSLLITYTIIIPVDRVRHGLSAKLNPPTGFGRVAVVP
jgi:peptidoglycan/LPS O-acetylase OafA/YrhL